MKMLNISEPDFKGRILIDNSRMTKLEGLIYMQSPLNVSIKCPPAF